MERQVLIVGAGGIGSWFIQEIFELFNRSQVLDCSYTVSDYDVVDLRNLLSQNFCEKDLFKPKVDCLYERFPIFVPQQIKIDQEYQLDGYDCVVCAVDSTEFRRLLFTHWNLDGPSYYFIDLRAEGRNVGFLTANKKWKGLGEFKLLDTLPEEEAKRGCQREEDLNRGFIELGNKIIAQMGAQLFLNWVRKKPNIMEFSMRI